MTVGPSSSCQDVDVNTNYFALKALEFAGIYVMGELGGGGGAGKQHGQCSKDGTRSCPLTRPLTKRA